MAKTALVDTDIEAGAKLLKALQKAGVSVAFAAWLRREGERAFRLYFGLPEVDSVGPFAIYEKILMLLKSESLTEISISDVIVLNAREQIFVAIASVFDINDGRIVFTSCHFGDIYIEHMVLYKADLTAITMSIKEFLGSLDNESRPMNRKQRRAAAAQARRRA